TSQPSSSHSPFYTLYTFLDLRSFSEGGYTAKHCAIVSSAKSLTKPGTKAKSSVSGPGSVKLKCFCRDADAASFSRLKSMFFIRRGILRPSEGIFETERRELRDPRWGILRPYPGNSET
ncbi:MAG: hypothetical protein IKO55_00745, partial [Kiritimatiellae bacterium]|nr:hypothetical protein [Kiritimatiellia bacterium]